MQRAVFMVLWVGALSACNEQCPGGCDPGEACVRNVCVADCGDTENFDEALGVGLVPIANICRPASAYEVRTEGGAITVYQVVSTTEGTSTALALGRWLLDEENPEPELTVLATAGFTAASTDVGVFAGQYIALDATASTAVIGLTTTDEGFPGELFRITISDAGSVGMPAPSNFDAVWADATHFVVNGAGLGTANNGQGLYVSDVSGQASHLATDLGDFSGSVDLAGSFVLAGGVVDGTFENHVYAIPATRVATAITDQTPIAVADEATVTEVLDPAGIPITATFSIVGERLVPTPFGGPLTSYRMSFGASGVTLSEPRVLAEGETFTDVRGAGEGRLLLIHGGGLLLVEEQ